MNKKNIVLALLSAIAISAASAVPIRFTGIVTYSNNAESKFPLSSEVFLDFDLDLSASDSNASATTGYYAGAAKNLVFSNGSSTYFGTAEQADVEVWADIGLWRIAYPLQNPQFPSVESLQFWNLISGNYLFNIIQEGFTPFSSDQLFSPTQLDLSTAAVKEFKLAWSEDGNGGGTPGNLYGQISGVTAVPEPASFSTVAGLIAVLICIAGRRRERA